MPERIDFLETPRLRLRYWRPSDRDAFAALGADPVVAADLGGPLSREESDRKFDRYRAAFENHGLTRWLLETRGGDFLGYTGVMPVFEDHPLGPHHEVGWRLLPKAWGQGYATEAARASMEDALSRLGLTEILAYTAADNLRSQAVMTRLKLKRDPSRDFTMDNDGRGPWDGLVWAILASENSKGG